MRINSIVLVAVLALTTASCGLVGGIFKGGFIIGLIIAVLVVGLLVKMLGGRGKAP